MKSYNSNIYGHRSHKVAGISTEKKVASCLAFSQAILPFLLYIICWLWSLRTHINSELKCGRSDGGKLLWPAVFHAPKHPSNNQFHALLFCVNVTVSYSKTCKRMTLDQFLAHFLPYGLFLAMLCFWCHQLCGELLTFSSEGFYKEVANKMLPWLLYSVYAVDPMPFNENDCIHISVRRWFANVIWMPGGLPSGIHCSFLLRVEPKSSDLWSKITRVVTRSSFDFCGARFSHIHTADGRIIMLWKLNQLLFLPGNSEWMAKI